MSLPRSLLITAAAGAAAGAVSAAALFLALETPPAEDETQTVVAESLGALEQENRDLRDRIYALETAAPPVQRQSDGPTRAEFEALLARLDGGSAEPALGLADLPTGPAFDAAVLAVVNQREEAEAEERRRIVEEKQRAKAAEQIQGTVQRMTDQLGLSEGQGRDLSEVITAYADDMAQLKRDWDGGGDQQALGQRKTDIQTGLEAGITRVLTPQQYTHYRELVAAREAAARSSK